MIDIFWGAVKVDLEPTFTLYFDDEVIPANPPRTAVTGNRSVLRLHISGHPAFAGVIMPFFDEFNHRVFSIPPGETIRAALFLLQGRRSVNPGVIGSS